MRRLLAAALAAALLVATPASAFLPGWTPERLARWTGCGPVTYVEILDPDPNAFFTWDPVTAEPIIGFTAGMRLVPTDGQFFVLLHELAHCAQWRDGSLWAMGPREREWDADRRAAEWACALGHDGPGMMQVVWDTFVRVYGVDPDRESYSHGSIRQRIRNVADRAVGCQRTPQAPFRAHGSGAPLTPVS